MTIQEANKQQQWDTFLSKQQFRPFLQSWTMGEVYRDIGQEPIRLEVRDGDEIVGICQAIVTPARRGKHLAAYYGPVIAPSNNQELITKILLDALKDVARDHQCTFVRLSPFWSKDYYRFPIPDSQSSPLHLLAEHIWYLELWKGESVNESDYTMHTEDEIMKEMRQNHRNLIRRAEREGVEVIASTDPIHDLDHFFTLYDETRKRHHFVPYTNAFIRAQVKRFSERNECTLYLAKYNDEVIASSVHMHMFGETSYHHGASTHKYPKVPASYLLQWTAITDALKRGDHIYSFWGIAPVAQEESGKWKVERKTKSHPFAGVTTFKMGFGGKLLNLVHCMDIPVSKKYYLTRTFETLRKWHRGF